MPILLTIPDDSPLAEALAQFASENTPPVPAPTADCPYCRGVYARETVVRHRLLEDEACTLCRAAVERVDASFREAARRHLADFRRELPQIVRDVRAGREEPTFYRGWE